jgi:ATP-dependent helicase HrpB
MISVAAGKGVVRQACAVAALLSSGDRPSHVDLLQAIEEPLGNAAQQQFRHLLRLVGSSAPEKDDDTALLQSILMGFPDRVAKRQSTGEFQLASGVTAEAVGEAPQYPYVVAVDAEDRTNNPAPVIRLLGRLEPEWLLDLLPDRLREEELLIWNPRAERVDFISRLLYDKLTLQETISAPPDPHAAAELLARMAIEAGIERFVDANLLEEFKGRVEFAGIDAPDMVSSVTEFSYGFRSFVDLKKAGDNFLPWLEQKLAATRLRENAPPTLHLKAGRRVKVHYESGKTPWIASRLQDFFGMEETPQIGPQRTPVVIHLLAPNQRPVQTTTDLAGFWNRLYPQVRRELMRRYPRHPWPEDHRS